MPGYRSARGGVCLALLIACMVTPTLDDDELERRITDLRAVEGWLKMNLTMLQSTIQGLEVQRATIVAVKAMQTPGGAEAMAAMNPFANPALWNWGFPGANGEAAAPTGDDAPPPDNAAPEDKPAPRKGRRA